jgi:hypothetical protein
MCTTCGCGETEARFEGHAQDGWHRHADGTRHRHAHHGEHAHGEAQARRLRIEADLLAANDAHAARNRARFARDGIFALNLVSSPGSGKTTLLCRTIEALRGRVAVGVIEGDQQTSRDAERVRATGARALQVNTGKGCHLDAHMVAQVSRHIRRGRPDDPKQGRPRAAPVVRRGGMHRLCPSREPADPRAAHLGDDGRGDRRLGRLDRRRPARDGAGGGECGGTTGGRGMTQAALRSVPLARRLPPVLAVGAWFKNTVCVTRADEAFVSAGVGDLADAAACRAFERAVDEMLGTLQVAPRAVAHDLHPDFHNTRFAHEFAARRGLPAVGVQHHHAHIAAVAAEHCVEGPLLGLALDGVGLGDDGSAWGGELLRVDGARSTRLGHLRALPLPGGDRAAREPWRMALAVLHALERRDEIARRYPGLRGATLLRMLDQGFNCPATSSAGRVFDAAA